MKYIKTFENLNEPQVGDYVICEISTEDDDDANYFIEEYGDDFLEKIKNTIGQIKHIENDMKSFDLTYTYSLYDVYYDFIKKIISFEIRNIKHFLPNKEDLETILNSKKYNL